MADNMEKKMKIAIDIGHPAHVNFFKVAARRLLSDGHDVTVIYINRGKLPLIVKEELREFRQVMIGLHKGSKYSVIIDANLRRFFQLLKYLRHYQFDIGLSVGGFNFGGVLKLHSVPNIQFDDDPERGINIFLEKHTSTQLYFPPIIKSGGRIRCFNALKEWAYLSPKYFTPDESVIDEYGLEKKDYIFVREVSTGTLNYSKQKSNVISTFADQLGQNEKVILSIEDKDKEEYYPRNWQFLREPLRDIHSLMYFSKLVISSGDSMAREGAILGVPSIYCGFREMKANKIMEDKNILYHIKPEEVINKLNQLRNRNFFINEQENFREKLKQEWTDVSEFIYETVKNLINYGKKD